MRTRGEGLGTAVGTAVDRMNMKATVAEANALKIKGALRRIN